MFIKYSTEQRLKDFSEKGEMYFSPAKKFREIEEKQKLKGQGDQHDSGLHSMASTVILEQSDGRSVVAHDVDNSILMGPAKDTPVFCLKCSNTEFITREYYEEIKTQFPEYTHALIIDNENKFLENIRFSFRNKAFSHKVFYQNEYFVDFVDFMYSGISDIRFYPLKNEENPIMHIYELKVQMANWKEIFLLMIVTISEQCSEKTCFSKAKLSIESYSHMSGLKKVGSF